MNKTTINTRNIDKRTVIFLFVVWAVAEWFMFFYVGSGEHDTFQMVSGIIHGVHQDLIFNIANYNEKLQFLFYVIFHFLAKYANLNSAGLLLLMNVTGAILSLAILFLLMKVLSMVNGQGVGRLAPVLIITTPTFLFIIPYGHPFHYAFALSLIAVYLLLSSLEHKSRYYWISAFLIATVLQGVALSIRMEQAGLFLFCVTGYFLYREKIDVQKYLIFCLHVCLALVIAFTLKTMIMTGGAATDGADASKYLSLLKHSSIKSHKLSWSGAHHLVEIGLPIILLSIFCMYKSVRSRNVRNITGFTISVLPPMLIYLFNPSPPRHLIITVISLAVFISACYGSNHKINIIRIGAVVLLINLLLPPVLSLTPFGNDDELRRNYTFNVIQRQNRNLEQSRYAFNFFRTMKEDAPDNTILIGNWVHIAQMSMILSDDPTLVVSDANFPPGRKVLRYSFSGKTFYLIESYRLQEVENYLKKIDRSKFTVLTLINKPGDINELDMYIPEQIYWWNA